jgi:hypothetical protein
MADSVSSRDSLTADFAPPRSKRRKSASYISAGKPNEQDANDSRSDTVVRPLDVVVHDRIGGPDKDSGPLPNPMQAEQNQQRADDEQKNLHWNLLS